MKRTKIFMDDYKEPSNNLNNGEEGGSDDWGQLMSDFGVSAEETNDNTQLAEFKDEEKGLSYDEFLKQPAKSMEASLSCAEKYLPQARVEEINNSLRAIEHIEQYETIGALRERGELTDAQEKVALQLKKDGFVGEMMTPDEAEAVYRYQHDADEEIIERKVDEISDMVSSIRCGMRLERSWTPRQERFLDYLTTKRIAYERGQVRTDLPFDIKQMYLDENESEQVEFYRRRTFSEPERFSYDEIPYTEEELGYEYEIPILDITTEEYLEDYDGDEDYLFAYGPYTNGDIKEIDNMCSPYSIENGDVWGANQTRRSVAWVQPISSRLLDVYAPIIKKGEKVGVKHREGATNEFRQDTPRGYSVVERGNLSEALTVNFIAKEVLKNRRPNARDLLALATAVGEAAEDIDENSLDEKQKKAYRRLTSARSYMSKYILEAVQIYGDEAKALYGKARPTSKQFYEDVRTRTEAWTEDQCKYYDTEKNDTMIKTYDYLLQCEAAMLDIRGGGSDAAEGRPELSANAGQRVSQISEALGGEQ